MVIDYFIDDATYFYINFKPEILIVLHQSNDFPEPIIYVDLPLLADLYQKGWNKSQNRKLIWKNAHSDVQYLWLVPIDVAFADCERSYSATWSYWALSAWMMLLIKYLQHLRNYFLSIPAKLCVLLSRKVILISVSHEILLICFSHKKDTPNSPLLLSFSNLQK